MLRAFGFVTHVEHPHKFVLSLLQILEVSSLLQEAWNLTNDRCAPAVQHLKRLVVSHRLRCSGHIHLLTQAPNAHMSMLSKKQQWCSVQ